MKNINSQLNIQDGNVPSAYLVEAERLSVDLGVDFKVALELVYRILNKDAEVSQHSLDRLVARTLAG